MDEGRDAILAAMDWPAAALLMSDRLLLEPLSPGHAKEMAAVLAPPALYEFIGGEPPSVDQLRSRYARQSAGRSQDGSQGWLNWIVRRTDSEEAVGFVQATLERDSEGMVADVAWVITPDHQGRGFAPEAATAVRTWLARRGVTRFVAYISPENRPSIAVARKLRLHLTDTVVDGEDRWESRVDDREAPEAGS